MLIRGVTLRMLILSVVLILAVLGCSIPGIMTPAPASGGPETEVPTSLPIASPTLESLSPAGVPDLPVISNPSLTQIHMLDVLNGWGTTETRLVRTVDGGLNWYDMTPPGVSSLGYAASIFFLDPIHGWVTIGGSDLLSGTMAITTDGGASWSAVAVPFANGHIQFINTSTGFILVGRGAAAGSSAVDVYSSVDGGLTWVPVYVMQPGAGEGVNSLPFSGQKSGISFLDSLHGWVGGNIPMEGYFYLYASNDGGHVWAKQDVSLPAGYETAMTEVGIAEFFSSTDGILPVRLMANNSGYVFYRTRNSGVDWISTSPVISIGTYSVASMMDIFVWDGGPVIHVSHDGGLTWNLVATNITATDILMKIVFVDAQTGWALTGDASNHHILYKTIDGGVTWNVLIP